MNLVCLIWILVRTIRSSWVTRKYELIHLPFFSTVFYVSHWTKWNKECSPFFLSSNFSIEFNVCFFVFIISNFYFLPLHTFYSDVNNLVHAGVQNINFLAKRKIRKKKSYFWEMSPIENRSVGMTDVLGYTVNHQAFASLLTLLTKLDQVLILRRNENLLWSTIFPSL